MKRQRQERDLFVAGRYTDGKNKENVVVGRTEVNRKSRIPVPTKPKTGTILTTVGSKENYLERLSPEVKSQVKQVPDFKKLHEQEQLKLNKAKQERRPTEVQEFALTPSAKRANMQQCIDGQEFEVDPRSLQAILDSKPIRGEFYHHNVNNTPSMKTVTRQSRGPHKPPWNNSPTCLVGRYSVYAKSMAEARALNASTPGAAVQQPKRNVDIVDELCNKLVASTLKKTIGRSRIAPVVRSAFQDVKLNLDGQFSECLEEQPHLKCGLPSSLPLRAPVACFEATGAGREDGMVGEDEEVTRLLQCRPKLYGASRSSCPNPVASELQMCYFIPVCI